METKTCKVCGRELPEDMFMRTKSGGLTNTCRECRTAALRANREFKRAQVGGGKQTPFSDPDFDGKEPGEVMRMMCRAKKWLESRNCKITLYGDFIETKTKKLKFE